MITTNSKEEAYQFFTRHFCGKSNPWIYDKDSSLRAGYNVFRDPHEFYNYMCDIGDRLEVNLLEGNATVNIWYGRDKNEDKPSLNLTNEEIKQLPKILFDYMNARIQTDSNIYDKHIQMCKSIMDKVYEIARAL